MAIQYTGVNSNTLYPTLTTRTQFVNAVSASLVSVGWTATGVGAFNTLIFSGIPANNDTITVNAKVYTFKTAINNAIDGQLFIGATTLACATAFLAAVTLDPVYAGSLYSTATTGPGIGLTAALVTPSTASVTITSTTLGPGASGTPLSKSSSAFDWQYIDTFSRYYLVGGGYKHLSAMTPQGLQILAYVCDCKDALNLSDPGFIRIIISNTAETVVAGNVIPMTSGFGPSASSGISLNLALSSAWRVISDPYQCFVIAEGVASTVTHSFCGFSVPWIPDFLKGIAISVATNANPISITTSVAHGYTTGQQVRISGVLGNTAANGTWAITVTSTTAFTLNGSLGNGAFTSGGHVGLLLTQCVEQFIAITSSSTVPFCRYNLSGKGGDSFTNYNGFFVQLATGVGSPDFVMNTRSAAYANDAMQWSDGTYFVAEPLIGWGNASSGTFYIRGQLWDALLINKAEDIAVTGTFDSHNWVNLTQNNTGLNGTIQGSLIHVVP